MKIKQAPAAVTAAMCPAASLLPGMSGSAVIVAGRATGATGAAVKPTAEGPRR